MVEPRQEHPHITALVLTRNQGDRLRACLEALDRSVPRETLEILVVDNGSSDETPAIMADFPLANTLRLPKDFGSTRALNIGIRTAKGELVFLLTPGVEVQPDTLSQLAARLLSSPDIGAVCPYVSAWYRLPTAADLKLALTNGDLPDAQDVPESADAIAVDYPRGAPLMIRRAFLVGMNYFDELFGEFWWDLELCWQIRNAGKRILILPWLRIGSNERVPASGPVASADLAIGASRFIGKHQGTGTGARLRSAAVLYSLGRFLTFRQSGFHFKRMSALLTGQKIDGTHI